MDMTLTSCRKSSTRVDVGAIALDLRYIAKAIGRRAWRVYGIEADDVEQQAMLRVISRADRVAASENPRGYAVTVIKGTVGAMIETMMQSKRQTVTVEFDDELTGAVRDDPLFAMSVESALAGVSDDAKRALRLVWVEGYDRKEAAEIMGISATSVNRLVVTAYSAVASELELPEPRSRERRDDRVYSWRHVDGRTIDATRKEMLGQGLSSGEVHMIVREGRVRKGWGLVDVV